MRRFLEKPSQVGSLVPSSHALAKEMVRFCCMEETGQSILEIGAGTGAFTRKIVQRLRLQDHLDVVELDPFFAQLLREKFQHLSNVKIHEVNIIDFAPEKKYDVIISGLPLNAFSPILVAPILTKYVELSKEDGKFSYFEYPLVAKFRESILTGEQKKDFLKVLELKNAFMTAYMIDTISIHANLPPARVIHCQINHIRSPY